MENVINNAEQLRRHMWQELPKQERLYFMNKVMEDHFGEEMVKHLYDMEQIVSKLPPMGVDLMLEAIRRHGLNATSNGRPLTLLGNNPHLSFEQVDALIAMNVDSLFLTMAGGIERVFAPYQIDNIINRMTISWSVPLARWGHKNYSQFTMAQRERFAERFALDWCNQTAGKFGGEPHGDCDLVVQAFVGDLGLSEETIGKLWDAFVTRRWQFACHPNLPHRCFLEGIEQLSDPARRPRLHNYDQLRKSLLGNPALDERMIHLFFADRDNWEDLARNPHLSVNMVYLLKAEESQGIHMALLSNRGLDPAAWNDVLDDVIKNNTPLKNCDIMLNPLISYDNLWKLYRAELQFGQQQMEWFFRSPMGDAAFRKEVLKSIGNRNFAVSFTADLVRRYPDLFDEEMIEIAERQVSGNTWEARHARQALVERRKVFVHG